jgi:protein-S-isoprenylcysteine O-methyltransferase Ste14
MYDVIIRLPLVLWALCASIVQLFGIVQYVSTAPASPIETAARVSGTLFLWLMAAMVILRTRPSDKAPGLEPRISALGGTFLMYGVVLFPRCDLSPSAEVIAILLTMIGTAGAILALAQLGRSFSLMAETRQLVTSGPYRFLRHPLYVAEEMAMIGLFMQHASIGAALLFAVQIGFQLRRMHNEEAVLTARFPEYAVYQQHTARLIPGIY